jgi:hypothetical protein
MVVFVTADSGNSPAWLDLVRITCARPVVAFCNDAYEQLGGRGLSGLGGSVPTLIFRVAAAPELLELAAAHQFTVTGMSRIHALAAAPPPAASLAGSATSPLAVSLACSVWPTRAVTTVLAQVMLDWDEALKRGRHALPAATAADRSLEELLSRLANDDTKSALGRDGTRTGHVQTALVAAAHEALMDGPFAAPPKVGSAADILATLITDRGVPAETHMSADPDFLKVIAVDALTCAGLIGTARALEQERASTEPPSRAVRRSSETRLGVSRGALPSEPSP